MRAAWSDGVGEPLAGHEVPLPRPAADEVLVRGAATGSCGSDVHIAVEGHHPDAPCVPTTLGHEVAGTVVVGRARGCCRAWRAGCRADQPLIRL